MDESGGWNGPVACRVPLMESKHDHVKKTLEETIAFHKKRALAEGIDSAKGTKHLAFMNEAKAKLQQYLEQKRRQAEVQARAKEAGKFPGLGLSKTSDKASMYDQMDRGNIVASGMAAKATNEGRLKTGEALQGHDLHKGMMKVAQRHEDEGRSRVAAKIRQKAQAFKGDRDFYGRGKESRRKSAA